METLLFSIPQINVHFVKSKLRLIESLGKRLVLFTSIYIAPVGKKYLYFVQLYEGTHTLTSLMAYRPTGLT